MSEETKQKLESLREVTNADSMSEVVRRALAIYDFLWEEQSRGSKTIIRSENGDEQILPLRPLV
jgi:hypothetical protein